ncbi:unnamed protein product [Closterium sp. NIES-54]
MGEDSSESSGSSFGGSSVELRSKKREGVNLPTSSSPPPLLPPPPPQRQSSDLWGYFDGTLIYAAPHATPAAHAPPLQPRVPHLQPQAPPLAARAPPLQPGAPPLAARPPPLGPLAALEDRSPPLAACAPPLPACLPPLAACLQLLACPPCCLHHPTPARSAARHPSRAPPSPTCMLLCW